MTTSSVSLRRFSRSFTQRVGVLEDRFLGRDRPLGASRLLWEIGQSDRTVGEIRTSLALDSAYVSRLLRQLESEGLIETAVHSSDKRRRTVRLTDRGRGEWRELERRSDDLANSLLDPLSARHRRDLANALDTADRLLRAATIVLEPADPLDTAAIESLKAYFAELDSRFDTGFDPGDAITGDAATFRPPNGIFLLARDGSATVACGAVHVMNQGLAEVKRMWVRADRRGLGLGRRMLAALEAEASNLGCHTVRLDTNSTLVEAISLYTGAGYKPIERYNQNPFAKCWFEKALVGSRP